MSADEKYILDLCDVVLGTVASRQHKFDFLMGDPNHNGRRQRLPVDAYYPSFNLVIEYREKQHSEPIKIMDRRATISGCSRGEQRKRYDEFRRQVLPRHGITVIELDYSMFAHDRRKRLRRDRLADEATIRLKLGAFLE